ncbi:MAG TPA: hypothetical protein VHY31_17895 [Streptosporangiaceae bacterium]|jgi:hypothetical protein|nr:hypothetical protein [Streptosporangiaceae bacterium]
MNTRAPDIPAAALVTSSRGKLLGVAVNASAAEVRTRPSRNVTVSVSQRATGAAATGAAATAPAR